MLYKAIKSFTGVFKMTVGEVKEISDASLAENLLKVGYIVELEAKAEKPKKTRKRKGK